MTSFKKGHFSQQKLQVFAREVITHKSPFLSCNHFFSTESLRLCFFYLCKCQELHQQKLVFIYKIHK